MKVVLQAPFFFEGNLYMKGLDGVAVDIPDHAKLPKSAKIVDADSKFVEVKPDQNDPNLLRRHDESRAAAAAEDRVHLVAEATRTALEYKTAETAAQAAEAAIETATSGGQKTKFIKQARNLRIAADEAKVRADKAAAAVDELEGEKE